jgi:exodeoxyribonuclease-5
MQQKEQFIRSLILSQIKYEPTEDQQTLVDKLSAFLTDQDKNKMFLLRGYAGTGKSAMVSALVCILPRIGLKSVLLGPTGRAAKVLSNYCKKPAQTIHKKIYFPNVTPEGHILLELKANKHTDTIFFVDEASMIPDAEKTNRFGDYTGRDLLDDLIRFVYNQKNCALILIGDRAQLPPVGLQISPALDRETLDNKFHLSIIEHELTQVVRQAQDSGILKNAIFLREHIRSDNFERPFFLSKPAGDVCPITNYEMEDALYDAYSHYGEDESIVVCRSNKIANIFNRNIRMLIHGREGIVETGDRIMIVKNNYYWLPESSPAGFIANGDLATIERITRTEERYGFMFADAQIRLIDYPDMPSFEVKLLLNTLDSETPALSWEQYRSLFSAVQEDYMYIPSKKKRMEAIREDAYFNALQIKFSYALTCHKTQGGQWKCVFVDQGYITQEQINKEFLRWLYTAVTRASERLYLVNFSDWFFEK